MVRDPSVVPVVVGEIYKAPPKGKKMYTYDAQTRFQTRYV